MLTETTPKRLSGVRAERFRFFEDEEHVARCIVHIRRRIKREGEAHLVELRR